MKVYTFHTDPGHGWLEVDRAELVELGILTHISQYSYQKGDKVYLEEDSDLGRFIHTLKDTGVIFDFNNTVESHRENTPIRGYERFEA